MNYLKKFENSEYNDYYSDILEIKDILISLKDEYPDITGEFYPFTSIDKKIKGITLTINTYNILPKGHNEKFSIEYSKLKLDLVKLLLETLERIENSLNKECRIINIWECGGENPIQINII